MSIGDRVVNFMVFIWLAVGFCLTYPYVAKYLAVVILFSCMLCIPRIKEVFCWILLILLGFIGVMEVWPLLTSI
jgi:hypothetical protein